MSASDEQIGGTHYRDMGIQPWDAMRAWMSTAQFAGFLLGNVIKYAARHQEKGGVQDLRKARHYLDKLIEVHEETAASCTAALSAVAEAPEPEWPGPDWEQAPEWAQWWIYSPSRQDGHWLEAAPNTSPHSWSISGGKARFSGDFGFKGDWRVSLRQRPEHRIDWGVSPSWAKFWAFSSDGVSCWYSTRPFSIEQNGDYLWVTRQDGESIDAPRFNYTGSWQTSLAERPEVV